MGEMQGRNAGERGGDFLALVLYLWDHDFAVRLVSNMKVLQTGFLQTLLSKLPSP